jgi:RNA polymerase sigma-70 factor, ECF subfamily
MLLKPTVEPCEARASSTAEDVFRLHAQDVARWAYRLGGPKAEVEDVVQDVFLKVAEHLPRWQDDGTAALTTWLFRITRNVLRTRRRRSSWLSWGRSDTETLSESRPSEERSPLEDLERRQAEEGFYKALFTLKERDRTAIVLFELEEKTGEEVAELLELPVSQVWVLLHRARARLLSALERFEPKDRP